MAGIRRSDRRRNDRSIWSEPGDCDARANPGHRHRRHEPRALCPSLQRNRHSHHPEPAGAVGPAGTRSVVRGDRKRSLAPPSHSTRRHRGGRSRHPTDGSVVLRSEASTPQTSAQWTTEPSSEDAPRICIAIPSGSFVLFRIGDAVAGRNIHAAIYDALRLMKDI